MKRTILTVIAILWALTTGLSASAESKKEMRDARFKENFPYKYEVTLGWGGYPIADDYMWGNGWGCAACASMADIYYM